MAQYVSQAALSGGTVLFLLAFVTPLQRLAAQFGCTVLLQSFAADYALQLGAKLDIPAGGALNEREKDDLEATF